MHTSSALRALALRSSHPSFGSRLLKAVAIARERKALANLSTELRDDIGLSDTVIAQELQTSLWTASAQKR